MKRFLFYILGMMFFVSCSKEELAQALPVESNPEILLPKEDIETLPDGVWGKMAGQALGDKPEVMTRVSLTYMSNLDKMKFAWNPDSKIGVYAKLDPANSASQLLFSIDASTMNDDKTQAAFDILDNADFSFDTNKQYTSYSDVQTPAPLDYSAIRFTYLNQTQSQNVEIAYYGDALGNNLMFNKDSYNEYNESEQRASAHLSKVIYMNSTATPVSEKKIFFTFNHIGATVRFFLKVKPEIKYDSLMIVNNSKMFTTEGRMDISTGELTPTTLSHTMTLKLKPGGFNFIDDAKGGKKSFYYDVYYDAHILVAYMEVAPIDLTGDDVEKSVLYLKGEDASHNKKYFKANISKKNIQAGFYYQWSINEKNPDEPITLTAIEVEEWEHATARNNGEGTQTW